MTACSAITEDGPCSLELNVFDALQFAQNPSGSPVLQTEVIIDDCGRFVVTDTAVPALGFAAVAVDDASASDNHVLSAGFLQLAANDRLIDLRVYVTGTATDQTWTTTGGSPFGGSTFSEVGVLASLFLDVGLPVSDVVATRNDSVTPADDYYFSDTGLARTTVDASLGATGPNGSALTINSDLVNHSGSGNEPAGCEWPSFLGDAIPGVVLVQEFEAVDSATGMPCTATIFADGFESGDLTRWSRSIAEDLD